MDHGGGTQSSRRRTQWDRTPDRRRRPGRVGGLVRAAASWLAWRFGADRPRLVAAEPDAAACLLESARAGHPVSLEGPLPTLMSGLRCAEPSPAAWPAITAGVDAFVSVSDDQVLETISGCAIQPPRTPPSKPASVPAASPRSKRSPRTPIWPPPRRARVDRSTGALAVVTEGRSIDPADPPRTSRPPVRTCARVRRTFVASHVARPHVSTSARSVRTSARVHVRTCARRTSHVA